MVAFSPESFGNAKYPFPAITPRSTLTWSGSSGKGPICESNRTVWQIMSKKWFMLNRIVRNRTLFTFKIVSKK